jgi:O-antigen/teichoic acid export membrane protein
VTVTSDDMETLTDQRETHVQAPLGRRVVRAGTVAVVSLLASQVISLASFVILARLAPPATFGAYAAASILLGWTGLFTESGMQAAVVQRETRLQEAASTALLVNLLGGTALGLLAAGAAPLVGLFFHSHRIGVAAAALAGTVPIFAASIVPGAMLQRSLSMLRTLVGPLSAIAYGVSSAAALAAGLGLWALVLGTYAAAVTASVMLWLLSGWRPSPRLVSWDMYRQLARYGRFVVTAEALREFGQFSNTAVVGRVLGVGTLGEYRYALQTTNQATGSIVLGGAYVLLPAFSRVWRDPERFRRALFRALRLLSLVVFPISLAFIPLGNAFAVILFGRQWRGAGPIMMALAGVGVAFIFDSVASEVFKARGRPDLLPRLHALTAVVPLALVVSLVPFWGPVGAGLGISVGALIVAVYAVWNMGVISAIPLRDILAQVRAPLVAAGVMAVALLALDHLVVHADRGGAAGLGLLVLDIVAGAAIYFLALIVVSRAAVVEALGIVMLLIRGQPRDRDRTVSW